MSFDFKEIDEEGLETLEAISNADRFNKWMYDTVRPHCKGKILEIGSGIGNMSKYFVDANADITLSDLRDNYLGALSKNLGNVPHMKMDLVDPDFDSKFGEYFNSFDTVFALNVVEHIEDDSLALANMNKLLKKGGNAVILVPAFQWLYTVMDKELEHYRRYTKKTLNKAFDPDQYNLIHNSYFNATGTLAWFIAGKILRNKTIQKGKMSLYNSLVPVFKIIDVFFKSFYGLSVVTVGQKK